MSEANPTEPKAQEQTQTPFYPEQGTFVSDTAIHTLLPENISPQKATILFIHAHPDDEASSTGATMGYYAKQGATVDLLTLTRGEMGEVIPEELKRLEATDSDTNDFGAALGKYREKELAQAIEALGVHRQFFLGQEPAIAQNTPPVFRDSGMVWAENGRAAANPNALPDCLTRQDVAVEARAIAAAIGALSPDVVVTYDLDGGYGHPDHMRTHEATMKAIDLLSPTGNVPCLVWGLEGELHLNDSRQQAVIDGSLERKRNAMAAHATQIIITGQESFQYSNLVTQKISARETFRLLREFTPVTANDQN